MLLPMGQDPFDQLNSSQRQAVFHSGGPLLVLAGAGSGKTRVVTCRILHLLAQGVPHTQIIALTFTNKAAGEMRDRLERQVALAPWLGTFHSFGLRILREWAHLLGIDRQFVIYDPDDCEKVIKSLLQEKGLKISPSSVASRISLCKNRGQRAIDVKQLPIAESDQLELDLFIELYQCYEQALLSFNAVDFDDLLFLCVQLFQNHPDLLNQLQQRWRYFLIDEYQDTNRSQYEMARLLAGPSPELFAVGDPDQSIYSWRGAEIENILHFERDFPASKLIRLEENYRSSPQILKAASELIAHNQQRYEKQLLSTCPAGDPIVLYTARDDRGEANFVTSQVERLLSQGQSPADIAVFYRTNFQSRAIEDALRRRGLIYRISGGISFYQRKEVKDLLAYLRLCLFDFDRLAFERALSAPKRGLGEKTLHKLFSSAADRGLSPLLLISQESELCQAGISGKARQTLLEFAQLINGLRQSLEQMSIGELIGAVVERIGYLRFLAQQDDEALDRMENINELIAKALEWAQLRGSSCQGAEELRCFLEEMNLGPGELTSDSEEAITLMTVHNAKGLEFDSVFIVGLEEMLFPHVNYKSDESLLEEERRLLYVGMTRARKRLYLSCASSRFLWGTVRTMRPSRFIHELPLEELQMRRQSWDAASF